MITATQKNLLTFSMRPQATVGNETISRLSQLIQGFPVLNVVGTLEKEISSITFDSRKATPGSLFVAIHGLQQDGNRFIQDALQRGAAAFITELSIFQLNELGLASGGATAICVKDSRQALAWVSARHYGQPSRNMGVVGITGTNGKTTLTYILEALYQSRGLKTGVIGTINYRYGNFQAPASVTTPESLDINQMLADMVGEGINNCFLEVSSHSIALKRVHEIHFSHGVFTNLSRDHLDFHVTMEHYKNAKKRLFQDHSMKQQVINIDDPVGREIVGETSRPTLTTGIDRPADIKAEHCELSESGTRFVLKTPSGSRQMDTSLLGKHNVYNLLSGAAVAFSQGFSLDEIERGLQAADCIPGRFERIDCGQDYSVVVDYAHTHEALENALTAARTLTSKNIIVVFGCGGDRDRGKRKEMARVALERGDFTVITSDNPRTEDPKRIVEDILAGVPSSAKENQDYRVIVDRRQAIEYAIENARSGDLILIAGKGHEDYQIIGSEKIYFDDREIAANAINLRIKRDSK
jgi:UDP-N-acetylmuramoyl-L-alanyl-D-glutamate--2,6-diaminopimelate ligase